MILLLRQILRASSGLLRPSGCGCASKRWKSTINIDRSLEHGSLIPNINLEEVGVSTVIGKRQYQEDRHAVRALKDGTLYLAVFDGHGGSLAADYAASRMPQVVEDALGTHVDIVDALHSSFIDMNSKLLDYIQNRKVGTERYSGTTATVCLITENLHIHTASVGDSRAIICRKSTALPLTTDHNLDRRDERERVQAEGGVVVSNSLGEPLVNGRLAMTRSIGDFDLKSYGVTAEPEYSYHKIKPSDDSFLALLTDGVSFSITNQEVADIILSMSSPQLAADQITDMSQQLGSQDNSTIVVLPLGAWGQHEPLNDDISYVLGRTLTPRD